MNFDQLVEFLAILQTNCVPTESLDIPTPAKFAIFECKFLALNSALEFSVLWKYFCYSKYIVAGNIEMLAKGKRIY